MHILLKTISDTEYKINDILPTITIKQLKTLIETTHGHKSIDQKIIYLGKILKNEQTLSEANINDGCTLNLIIAQKQPQNTLDENIRVLMLMGFNKDM